MHPTAKQVSTEAIARYLFKVKNCIRTSQQALGVKPDLKRAFDEATAARNALDDLIIDLMCCNQISSLSRDIAEAINDSDKILLQIFSNINTYQGIIEDRARRITQNSGSYAMN